MAVGNSSTDCFSRAKELLTSSQVLVHFDQTKPLGFLAMLHHMALVLYCPISLLMDQNAQWHYIASRSLSPAECKYAQLDKEGLAIIFGVKCFHQYLLGRKFTIYSDQKPLEHLFCRLCAVLPVVSARIQWRRFTPGAYDYNICCKPGKDQVSANFLSRLPMLEAPREAPVPADNFVDGILTRFTNYCCPNQDMDRLCSFTFKSV